MTAVAPSGARKRKVSVSLDADLLDALGGGGGAVDAAERCAARRGRAPAAARGAGAAGGPDAGRARAVDRRGRGRDPADHAAARWPWVRLVLDAEPLHAPHLLPAPQSRRRAAKPPRGLPAAPRRPGAWPWCSPSSTGAATARPDSTPSSRARATPWASGTPTGRWPASSAAVLDDARAGSEHLAGRPRRGLRRRGRGRRRPHRRPGRPAPPRRAAPVRRRRAARDRMTRKAS